MADERKKIVILGAKGNLGQAFAELYKKSGPLLLDRDELDITDQSVVDKFFAEHKPEIVINCAAYNAVDKAETEQDLAIAINGHAVGYLAKASKNIGALLVHYSTHYVFDGQDESGYNEDRVPNASSVYARSKILGEQQLQKFGDRYYLIRTAWLYSHGAPGGKKSFIDIMLELASKQPELQVVNDEIAHPTNVKDLAEATSELISAGNPSGIYHLINHGTASWYDWAKEIFSIKNMEVKINPVPASQFPRPVMRPHFGIINNTKLPAMRPWQEALKEFLTI